MSQFAESMPFGTHHDHVNDVLHFVQSGKVLIPKEEIDDSHFLVSINDFDEALTLAWEQGSGPTGITWSNIRSDQMSLVWRNAYQMELFKQYDEQLTRAMSVASRSIERQLGQYGDLLDDVISDLQSCAYSRLVFGLENQFFESLFAIYRDGGWPCGWNGSYPKGVIVAFFPRRQ